MSNNQNNPQEVPQVKSVEEQDDAVFWQKQRTMLKLESRIAELEAALLKVRDRHIKNPITYTIITKALSNEA